MRASPPIDETLESFLPRLQPRLRAVASNLPRRLGLCDHDQGRWSDFVTLDPNRDLPVFALVPAHLSVDGLERFRAAHHHAAYWGLVADRLADLQVRRSTELIELRRLLLHGWVDSLAAAIGDRRTARSTVCGSLCLWRRGLRSERDASRAARTSLSAYIAVTRDKLYWIASSACAMYPSPDDPRRRHLRLAADLFLMSCQLRDDAIDDRDDVALRGASVASLLGVSAADLYRAAPRVARAAAVVAERGGHVTLAAWLSDYSVRVDTNPPPILGLGDESRAAALAAGVVMGYSTLS